MLAAYDDEWDHLMFQEYMGVNPVIVAWELVLMVFCYLFLSKYLMSSFTNEIDAILGQPEGGKDSQEESRNEHQTRELPNQVFN